MLFRLAPHPHERVEQIVNYLLLFFGHASFYSISKHAGEGVQARRSKMIYNYSLSRGLAARTGVS